MTELQWGDRRHVEVEGISIHVETAGPDHGPTVVALHGFTSGTFTWAGVVPSLARRARVVAWDRPPFGRSDRPDPRRGPDDPYAVPAQLRQMGALVEQLAPGPVVLLGHSAGSLLAVQAMLAGVVDAAAAILIAPALAGGPPPLVRSLARIPGLARLGPAALKAALLAATPAIRSAGRHATPLLHATAKEAGDLLRTRGTAEAMWHLTTTWEPATVIDRLHEVLVPTTVVGGVEDRIVSADQARAAALKLRGDLHLLEGVGHAAQEQVPDRVAEIVGSVLERLGDG